MKTIKLPAVSWVLGDPEQSTASGVTIVTRPLYYRPHGKLHPVRVANVNPDYAEALMTALGREK